MSLKEIDRDSLVNEARAAALLAEVGADAFVASRPVEVYYFPRFWTILAKMGFEQASLALWTPQAAHRTLVVSAAQIWRLALEEADYPARIIAYTAPTNWQDWLQSGGKTPLRAAPSTAWPVSPDADLAAIERAWIAATRRTEGHEAPTAHAGLARAITEAGLARGRIVTDDVTVEPALRRAGLDQIDVRCDPNLFRRLRVVKSQTEIALMQRAARMNAAACLAAVRDITVGTTMEEIERRFGVEAAQRGGESVFIAAGGTGLLPKGHVVRGEPFLIDAVSHYGHYHGDFGRTVILGEPDAEARRRVAALRIGWEASFAALRPGRRYSEVRSAGLEAMRKAGYGDVLTVAVPHSVGLQHTDEPFRDGLPFAVKDDLVLEENMTLTVDFPHIEVGFGACHLEDLVRVTRDGAEPLAAMDDPLIVL